MKIYDSGLQQDIMLDNGLSGGKYNVWVIYEVYYMLTYSMEQSPSLEANRFAASQEIPHILWNPKVHYQTHKNPPYLSILNQTN
jgi:hypothetical protein